MNTNEGTNIPVEKEEVENDDANIVIITEEGTVILPED